MRGNNFHHGDDSSEGGRHHLNFMSEATRNKQISGPWYWMVIFMWLKGDHDFKNWPAPLPNPRIYKSALSQWDYDHTCCLRFSYHWSTCGPSLLPVFFYCSLLYSPVHLLLQFHLRTASSARERTSEPPAAAVENALPIKLSWMTVLMLSTITIVSIVLT
jgi:hypothetical protein